jgi:hypothetical protein
MKEPDFSDTAKHIMRFLIINHCKTQPMNYKTLHKISDLFDVPVNYLLLK